MQSISNYKLTGEKRFLESSLALSWPKRLPSELPQSPNVTANTAHGLGKLTAPEMHHWTRLTTWGKLNPSLGNEVTGKTYIDHAGKEIIVPQPGRE